MAESGLPPDTAWEDLTFSEQFLLWAIRMWAQLSDDPVRASDFISPAFERVGAAGGGSLFHSFMCGVTASARRRIEVRCPRSSQICSDEFGLMRVLQASQRERQGNAHAQLADFVHEDAIRHVLVHASLLMRTCLRGGVVLRPVEASAAPTRSWSDDRNTDVPPPNATIH